MQAVLCLTTCRDAATAHRLGLRLVELRLAACVNVLPPMLSIYRWQGAVERAHEVQVVIKTTRTRVTDVEKFLIDLHPYDLPEFLVVEVSSGSRAYLDWILDCVVPDIPSDRLG